MEQAPKHRGGRVLLYGEKPVRVASYIWGDLYTALDREIRARNAREGVRDKWRVSNTIAALLAETLHVPIPPMEGK